MAISDINQNTKTYKVVSGDSFSKIAERCIEVNMPGYAGLSVYNAGINKLHSYNPDVDTSKYLIYVGQTLTLQNSTAVSKTTNRTQRVKITNFGLQSNSDKTVFATWAWDNSNTDHYEIVWKYGTGDGVAFIGERTTTTDKQAIYSNAPTNADCVKFQVRPISKTYKSGNKDVKYWTADWSSVETYYFKNNPPSDTGVPDVSGSSDYTLLAKLSNLDINATSVEFRIYDMDAGTVYKTGTADIKLGTATYSCTIKAGGNYTVRSRGVRGKTYGKWSDYSNNVVGPDVGVGNISSIYALSSNEVEINWEHNGKHKIFDIQYTTNRRYFDSNPNGLTTVTIGSTQTPYTIGRASVTNLQPGNEYFFRLRGRTTDTISKSLTWSNIVSITVGTPPTAPTTWSSASTINEVGTPITLNWTHNSLDGSRQTEAILELTLDDGTSIHHKILNGTCSTTSDITEKEVDLPEFTQSDLVVNAVIKVYMSYANTLESPTLKINGLQSAIGIIPGESVGSCIWDANSLVVFTYNGTNWVITNNKASLTSDSYTLDTSNYSQGTIIHWNVKTAGVLKDSSGAHVYGPASMNRTIKIYSKPELSLTLPDLIATDNKLTSFPLKIKMEENSVQSIQSPIGYQLTITSLSSYETVDNIGNTKLIGNNQTIYSKYFDATTNPYEVILSAGDLNLENGINYLITCTVSMNSGLTGEDSEEFEVAWSDAEFWPNAEISYDENTYTASVSPYCKDEADRYIEGIKLMVYRREFDGTFTKLSEDYLDNVNHTFITDPHPSLDFARYRVVAITESTGVVTYYDVPGFEIGEKAAIIQWDEAWTNFDITNNDELEQPSWSGSLLRLPYNINISDEYKKDTEHIEYIGRKYPVSYYGTQKGHTSKWNMEIPKNDTETLYALRRLAAWIGDVYVREPSGSGYWASVKVSYNQNHCELTIPITLDVTRVEGEV